MILRLSRHFVRLQLQLSFGLFHILENTNNKFPFQHENFLYMTFCFKLLFLLRWIRHLFALRHYLLSVEIERQISSCCFHLFTATPFMTGKKMIKHFPLPDTNISFLPFIRRNASLTLKFSTPGTMPLLVWILWNGWNWRITLCEL